MADISCTSCGKTIEASGQGPDQPVKCPDCGHVADHPAGIANGPRPPETQQPGQPAHIATLAPNNPAHTQPGDAPTLPPSAEAETKDWEPRLADCVGQALPDTPDVPRQAEPDLPGYEILAELGRGGMGVVYKARQTSLNRLVAVKMILAGSHASPADMARFLGEAQAVAQLEHPNLVRLYEVGQHSGLPYFTMEFVAGGSLSRKLDGTPLPAKDAARLVEQLAHGIQYAHQRGIVHRDLKPGNILLQSLAMDEHRFTQMRDQEKTPSPICVDPRSSVANFLPKITDFGLAKRVEAGSGMTATGAILGTPSYMAPEQAEGKVKEVGPLADVYALGAMLYECLTGRPPFHGPTALDTLQQVVSDEPVSPARLNRQVPRDLETICLKCLQKEPARRYADGAGLAEDLRHFQAGEPIQARPVSVFERTWRWCRRKPAGAALLAACVLLAIGIIGGALWYVQDRAERWAETDKQNALNEERVRSRLDRTREIRAELHKMLDDPKELNRFLNDPGFWQGRIDAALLELREAKTLQAAGPIDPALQVEIEKLAGQFREEQQHRETVLALEKARGEHSLVVEGKLNFDGALKRYRQAFAQAGLDVDKDTPNQLAEAIGRSPLRHQLLVALDDFGYVAFTKKNRNLQERLLNAARLADPDPWRGRLRDPNLWGDHAAAEELAHQFLNDPDRLTALSAQSLEVQGLLLPSGNLRERWLRQANRLHPDDFWLVLELAKELDNANRHAEAVGYYSAALGLRPRNTVVWNNLGNALREAKDLPAAIDALKKALAIDNQFALAWNNLGVALQHNRNLPAAIDAYRKALAIDKQFALAWYNLGIALRDNKDLPGAIDAYQQALAIDERHAYALASLGLAYRELGRLAESVKALRQAAKLRPDHPLIRDSLQACEQALAWRELSKRKPLTEKTLHNTLSANPEQAHELKMRAGKIYAMDLTSREFDTFLRLEDGKQKVLAENDDIAPDNLNSRIIFTPKEDGIYRIIATSFEHRGRGGYTLTIREFEGKRDGK